ncbi:hypothetical protein EWM64_g9689 [Hericium alpestre]|uniref:DUF4939 domain-containing protein n=1 Tax=Hericium alpestre TaxID=135208 RepID=A0A4Y9ZKA3_9AGAM|nr:hypothetical protein EWM64_g9689 [Hericium alpestre]
MAKGPDVNKPMPFTGVCTKLKEFISQCKLHFRLKGDWFPDEATQIYFALSYIQGRTAGP